MAYANYADLQAQAPEKMRRKATQEAFQAGMGRVAPPGMKPRQERVNNYHTDPDLWLQEWKAAMFT